MKTRIYLLSCFLYFPSLWSRGPGEEVVPIGNFALPTSQRPGSLLGIGQSFVDKGDLLISLYNEFLRGKNHAHTILIPSLIYGISEKLYATLALPIFAKAAFQNSCSRGAGDLFFQLEYLAHENGDQYISNYISLVGAYLVPTGSATKEPPTGFGSSTFLAGFTAGSLQTEWYFFGSAGALITTSHRGTLPGRQFLYQGGIGKNIAYLSGEWLLTGIVEFDGIYIGHNKTNNMHDCTSGSNKIFITPSVWFATQHFSLQIGVAVPVLQQFNGFPRAIDSFLLQVNASWKF